MTLHDKENNDWADYWFYIVGANVIPADTKRKSIHEEWDQYQSNPLHKELHEERKRNGSYANGIAVILGKLWRGPNKGLYLNGIDCDNLAAIQELCTKNGKTITVEELAKWTIVERHKDDLSKLHIYIMSTRPFRSKSSSNISPEMKAKIDNNQIPAIEVKSNGKLLFCTPSFHKDGERYEIVGTDKPALCDDYEKHIDNVLKKYGISYLSSENRNSTENNGKTPIEQLFDKDCRIYKGNNRHEALLRVMESLIYKFHKMYPEQKIKKDAYEWNQTCCVPPLDDKEFERQWKDAKKFIERKEESKKRKTIML